VARVIIAEDCSDQAGLYGALLRSAGHEVVLARNGGEALKIYRKRGCDIILTDLFMPDCDGIEVIRALRMGGVTIPIIAMSGGQEARRELFLRVAQVLGANEMLMKPISARGLMNAVARQTEGAVSSTRSAMATAI
jgi:CheY-like chemotaxis protein